MLAWRAAHGYSRLVWMDRAGVELKSIGRASFNPDGRLSPDGHRYAVGIVDPKQGVSDIWIFDLDRDSSERVTFTTLDEKAPVWAPDGRTLYYRSDGGGGPPDIFRLRPGEDRGSVFYSGPGVEEAQDASPDGKWLLFIDYRQSVESDIKLLSLSDAEMRALAEEMHDQGVTETVRTAEPRHLHAGARRPNIERVTDCGGLDWTPRRADTEE